MLGGNFLEITILEGTSSQVAYKIHPLGRSIFWNHGDFPVEHPIGSAFWTVGIGEKMKDRSTLQFG
jgi:hypothetical protein